MKVVLSRGTSAPFPLAAHSSGRYLVTPQGARFSPLGRASWYVLSLSVTAYKSYLDDTISKGFNAIEFKAPGRDAGANNAPFNGASDLPFSKKLDGTTYTGSFTYSNIANDAPDFSQPNATYWAFVLAFVDYCATKGILCCMFPAYVGYLGIGQGWLDEMVANGTTKMQAYGAYIAGLFKDRANIVWMLGGDAGTGANTFTAPQTAAEQALITGLLSVTGQRSRHYCAEWNTESIATDQVDFGGYMTMNGAYSFNGNTATYARNAYSASPAMPAFLLEEPYDETDSGGTNENAAATQPIRRFLWWGLINSGGYIAGNGYVWRFNSGYTAHMNTQTASDCRVMNLFWKSLGSHLVPDGLGSIGTLITANKGTISAGSTDYVAAAAAADGSLLVAYCSQSSGNPTVDMTKMRGTTLMRWMNPTTGVFTAIGSFANTGTQTPVKPGDNGSGFSDHVLVMTA